MVLIGMGCGVVCLVLLILDLRYQRDAAIRRADDATNRLLAAWKDGYAIPEPEADPIEEEPLPPALAAWLTQWEGAEAQAQWEAELRRQLARGRTVDQILMDLELAS